MGEQLVTFETAKLAKEKGFDKWFSDYSEKNHHLKGWRDRDEYLDEVELPSEIMQSLIQKWLREIHGLYIEIMVSNQHIPNKGLIYTFIVLKPDLSENRNCINHVSVSKEPLDTYEEALEQGLLESLKLIKNEMVK